MSFNKQSLRPAADREDKYPQLGIIIAVALNLLTPFISPYLAYLAMALCVVRVIRYDERVFATDYSILITVSMLFRTTGGMSLLIYLCLFADVWYFIRRGIRAEAPVVLVVLLANYLLLRMQMNFADFALCFGQLFLLRILLPEQDEESSKRSIKAFCMGLILTSAYALIFRENSRIVAIRGPEAPAFFGSSIIRFYGLFQDPNYFSLLLISGLAGLMKLKDCRAVGWPTFIIGGLLLIGFGVLTISKTFFLMLLLLIVLYLVWQFWNKKILRGVFMTGGVALAAAVLLLGDNSPFATVLDRLASATSLSDLTTGRSDVFSAYLGAITENVWSLLFGAGLAASNLGRDPHNLYIEIAYYLGIVGLGLIIAYYCSLIHSVNYRHKTYGRQNFIAKYLPLLMVALIHMTLHGMTTFPAYMAFFMAALSMLVVKKPEEVAQCQD